MPNSYNLYNMELNERLELSYYQEIASIHTAHQVALVQHSGTKKVYVKKVLDIYQPGVYERLLQNHIPGTPRIYALYEDTAEKKLTVIEEYIPGETLEEIMQEAKDCRSEKLRQNAVDTAITLHRTDTASVLTPERITDVLIGLCGILQTLHGQQPPIIHRDIKPSNVILTPSGHVVLLDMNAAKLMDAGKDADTRLLGTRGYAAPEQYGFGSSDVRTDIYACGVLLRELLDAHASIYANGVDTRAAREPDERIRRLRAIAERCTMLDPVARYSSVAELRAALSAHGGTPTQAEGATGGHRHPFLPPGYRSLNPSVMLIASIAYMILFGLCMSLDFDSADNAYQLWVGRSFTFLAFLSVAFFSADYMHIQERFPLCRHRHRSIRVLGIVLADFLIILFWILLLAIITS